MGAKLLHVRRRITTEYLCRVKRVWKSRVNARSKVKLHNTWSAAVLRYFFGSVRWGRGDLRGMDRATRRIMRRCQRAEGRPDSGHKKDNEKMSESRG